MVSVHICRINHLDFGVFQIAWSLAKIKKRIVKVEINPSS
jgi:hypothetical protein